ncbi:hypothetical protein L6E12_18455 [Actinokineospora sp. PR83]|uniref:hypothetical protein n=1 Tax=Actinokineospora sp. PR83 TaxID=2884908 RepID=UPI001F48DC0C|nr:hypothetical protein [Actinokineospora sp. PR83]MCG8917764.1 hypothetical protein [Actinokineospora sp. PR83]
MRKPIPALAAALTLTGVAASTTPAPASATASAVVRGVVTTTPQDLVAMGPITIDKAARTFTFPTARRFDVPKEVVTAHWVGTSSLYEAAVTRIERGPSLFHVFRLSLDGTGRVVADNYYYTPG